MPFNKNDKDNQPLVDFFKEQHALVADTNSSSRKSIQKMLLNIGFATKNVETTEKFSEAIEAIQRLNPKIVFADFVQNENDGVAVYQELQKAVPNKLDRTFILLSSNNSKVMAGLAAESEVDSMVVRPYTPQDLEDKFISIVKQKLNPIDYEKIIEDGRQALLKSDWGEAISRFKEAQEVDSAPALACFYEGYALKQQDKADDAEACYAKGLELVPDHHRCLQALMESAFEKKDFAKAYSLAEKLCEEHPVSPRLISMLVRLSVYNSKYEDVMDFVDLFADVEDMDDTAITYISAGIVVCAKHFVKLEKTDEAIEILTRMEKVFRKRPGILREAIITLISIGAKDDYERLLERAPDEVRNATEVKLAVFEAFCSDEANAADAKFQKGRDMIDAGTKHPNIFDVMIQLSFEMGRNASTVEELKEEAASAFPDERERFEETFEEHSGEYEEGEEEDEEEVG